MIILQEQWYYIRIVYFEIHKFHGVGGVGHEIVRFLQPVRALGNIEDWLLSLLQNMQRTMKDHARSCAAGVAEVISDLDMQEDKNNQRI
jgi:hypothetical protein